MMLFPVLQTEREFLVKILPPPFWLGAISYLDHLRRKGGGAGAEGEGNRSVSHRYNIEGPLIPGPSQEEGRRSRS